MISILITHYNRPEALKSCLAGFQNLPFSYEIVVSDDGSSEENQQELQKLSIDKLLLHPVNSGLTSSINRGLRSCKKPFILYCQEDFLVKEEFTDSLPQILDILKSGKADMVRLTANYHFPKLLPLTASVWLIPKFSWKNFYYNSFQYSDNPFLTTASFFDRFGYYLENTSGSYGENEYAIRIMKSKAKIGIHVPYLFEANPGSESVMMAAADRKKRRFWKKLNLYRFLRAVRLHAEYLLYNPKNRKLRTFKNFREE